MADYDSGLPIRTEADGTDERLHVKIVDGTSPAVNQMQVDSDKNAHVEVHGNRCDDAADVALQLSEQGRPNPRGDYQADDNSCPASAGLIAHTRNASPADTQLTSRITSVQDSGGTVRALDVSLHDSSGEPISTTNPIPVSIEPSAATEVHDYAEQVDVAAGSSANHNYSVADGETVSLCAVLASASGKMKVEIQVGDGAASEVFTTKFVRFNSTASPNADTDLCKSLDVVGTVNTTTIRVILTNLDLQPQSLYSTIIGSK